MKIIVITIKITSTSNSMTSRAINDKFDAW